MRDKLFHDRQNLEQLLNTSLPRDENLLRLLSAQLEKYNYLKNYNATLHTEKDLKQRYSLMRAAIDARLDTVNTNAEVYVAIAKNIFQGKNIIGSKDLLNDCNQLYNIAYALREMPGASAERGLQYIKRETESLLDTLNRYIYSLIARPNQEGWRGLENAEQTNFQIADCTTIEYLLKQINQISTRTEQLLFHNAASAKGISHYGTVFEYSHIPFACITTDSITARELLARKDISIRKPLIYHLDPKIGTSGELIWNLELINAPKAWESTRGEGVRVAVIDTGIDYEHPDLQQAYMEGVDCIFGNSARDDNGHGTHVAGTIAGSITGVAPEAKLYGVKVLDAMGSGSEVDVLKGMEWAITHNADVMNMSLGSFYQSIPEGKLISIAVQRGIAVCAAAGNEGSSDYSYPASHEGAISVAAIDRNKQHARFSNFNDKVAICAPGVEVSSTWLGGGYETLSGTSMATPHVSGVCALLRNRTDMSAREMLQKSAEYLGNKDKFGAGLVDAAEAVKL